MMIFGKLPRAESFSSMANPTTRRSLLALMTLLIVALAGCGGGGGSSSDSNSGSGSGSRANATITGRVVDAGSQPVPNAGVAGARITGAFNATTDSTGTFSASVSAGTTGTITVIPPNDSNGNQAYYGTTPVTLVFKAANGTTDPNAGAGKTYDIGTIAIRNLSSPPAPPL